MTPEGQSRYARWFVMAAGLLLLATGLAKVLSGFGTSRVLALQDPLIGIFFGKLLPAVGLLELAAGLACFSRTLSLPLRLALVAWISTDFLVYRVSLWWIGWHHPCACMGGLAGALHLSDQAADNVMKVVLMFLLLGSYTSLCLQWRAGSRDGRLRLLSNLPRACMAVWVALCVSSQPVRALGFDGTVSYTGTISNHFLKAFHADVDGPLWWISTWSAEMPGISNVVGFDGTNLLEAAREKDSRAPQLPRGSVSITRGRSLFGTAPWAGKGL